MGKKRVIKGFSKKLKLKQRHKVRENIPGKRTSAKTQRLNLLVTNSKASND